MSAEALLPLLQTNPEGNPSGIGEFYLPRQTPAKLFGLLFGGMVVVVMLFMMFVLLGNLFMGEQ